MSLRGSAWNCCPPSPFWIIFSLPRARSLGASLTRRQEEDVAFGFEIARETSRLDIGQTVIVKNGTVLAVEAFEGTNEAIKRGGALAGKGAVMVKVAKPNQDMRFDVPVIGPETVRIAAAANIRVIAIAAGKTLLLEKERLIQPQSRQTSRLSVASCNQRSEIYNQRFFCGVLAQLVERLNGIQEVRGSNPLGSTGTAR